MGRKTLKSVQKQLRRREEKKRLVEALDCVNKANLLKDPLEEFPAFRNFSNKDLTLSLECKRVKQLELSVVEWILRLEKSNMESLYNACDWGWDEEKKNSELTDDMAWYLIAYTNDRVPVAFCHFRFDMDYAAVRRQKLGKFMMQVLELIAFKNHMKKVVLTVFKHNPGTLGFFKSLNYTLDSTSPEEEFCYLVLSKLNKRMCEVKDTKS
ncbi:hypothetical protein AAG570_002497 [Ranatra chinensis]|uniref:N-alpha-acetyltransferase 40 n=1 Tax=Ranatra chinensis TaxID=642074 RepID=A0ABD0YJZ1_9HEMI